MSTIAENIFSIVPPATRVFVHDVMRAPWV